MIETLNTAASPARYASLTALMEGDVELSVSAAVDMDDYSSTSSSADDDSEHEADNMSQADKDKLNTRLLRILKDNTVGAGLDG